MKDLIGSWQNKEIKRVQVGVVSFDLPDGAIVSVRQVDELNNKVLVDFVGPVGWKHKRFLDGFEALS